MATHWWICRPKLSTKCCVMKLIQKNADTNEATLVAVTAAALVERVVHKVPEVENKTLGRRLGDSENRTTK